MGTQASKEPPDEQDDDCCNCFFFSPGRQKSDTFGTPLPSTPLFRKQKQQEREIMSSRYGGLEKEAMEATLFYQSTINGNGTKLPAAEVHEGPQAEFELKQKYELKEVLGVGSTSTCHLCVCRATGESYACKIIDKHHIEDRFQGMMDQFHVEIEALRALNHPNIIRLFDVYVTQDKIFIVMELMQGGELFDYVVQKGTLTEEEASRIVRSVTSAMVYMHSKNIIHRDLKPENLLLKEPPKPGGGDLDVRIIDFGLSKLMEEPVARSFLGTRGYLAPEMLQRRDYSRAVDTWALGVIVFVLLCGCLPFDDDSQAVPSDDLVQKRFVLRFPRWAKNLSASAKDLLAHLLDVDPRRRYTAEQALRHPWVQGETAPRDNLLESPRMIRKSPRTPTLQPPRAGARAGAPNHVHAIAPKRPLVRKTSI